MKNILIFFCIINLIFLSSCGYKVLNNINNTNFEIVEIDTKGNDKINNKLEKFFSRYKDKDKGNSSRLFNIQLNNILTKKVTSKNNAGEDVSFSMKINVELDIIENNQIIKSNTFEKKINYNNLDSKFELKQYENVMVNNLVDEILVEINSFLGTIK